jgi:hypothetical protein
VYRTAWAVAALCLGIGLCLPAGARTADAAKPDYAGTDRLVEQLGDPDYRRRDDAAMKLRSEGLAALPALRAALNHADPEVRRRAGELVPVLETAALLAPKRVTLKVDNRPVREVLDSIEKQTGYKIETWGPAGRTNCSFDFADLPFWQALDVVCRGTGLVLQQGYGDDHVRLQAQEGHIPYLGYDGPFRIVPTGFQHYRNIEFGLVGKAGAGANRIDNLTLTFSIFSEPKLPLLGMGEVRLEAAYDSERNSMLPTTTGPDEYIDARFGARGRWTSRYGTGNRTTSLQTQIMLSHPSEKATGVKLVRGRIPVTLLADQKPEVIAADVLKAKGVRTKIDSTSFHVEDVSQLANKQVLVKMTVSEETDNPHDYTWMNSLYQRIELQDDKGNKYMIAGNGWGNHTPGSVQLTTTFAPQGAKAGKPAKLIYYRWTTLQHEVAFEFRDLPLP